MKKFLSPLAVRTCSYTAAICLALVAGIGLASAADFDTPVASAELAQQRGREGTTVMDITTAISQIDGQLSDNVASGNQNGANVISGGAFSGLNGHASVIQNSGNNNIIQDSTIYNFSIRP